MAAYSCGVGKILLVVVVFAALTYGVFWLLERRGRKKGLRGRPSGPRPAAPRRSTAPDDDEDFLRELERRRRRAAREQAARDDETKKPKDSQGDSSEDRPKPE